MSVLKSVSIAIFGKRIIDPLFGRLSFRRVPYIGHPQPPGRAEYWDGDVQFAPFQHEVRVIVYADASGPQDFHRNLYLAIQDRWTELHALAIPHLIQLFCKWFQMSQGEFDKYGLDPGSLFQLIGVNITPRNHSREAADFVLAFAVPERADPWHSISSEHDLEVAFNDWSVLYARING